MSKLALVDPADQIIRQVRADRVDLTAGVRAGYRWLPVEVDRVNTSTGPDTVTEYTGPVVEVSRVAYTLTTRDMTAQEISDRNDGRVSSLVNDPVFKALATAVFELVNDVRTLKGQGTITPAQFRAYLKSKL